MRKAKITRRAKTDLDEIWLYIARDSIDAAERVIDEIEQAIHRLAEMLGIGHTRDDVPDPRYRFWSVHSYVIVYRPDTKPIEITRIISGYRDFSQVFR